MIKTNDESWERYPEAKIRMREDGLKAFLEGLGVDGFCHGTEPRIQLLDDGIYISMLLNVGRHGSVIALPFEVFIPVSTKLIAKKYAKDNEVEPDIIPAPLVELHDIKTKSD
jgi:hypothetical protein